jgi:hypothetical protein
MIFGLRAPTVGNKTLALSWTGSNTAYVSAIAFDNVAQASDAAAFPVAGRVGSNTGTTALATTPAFPSSTNNYTVAVTVVPPGSSRLLQSDTELYYSTASNANSEVQYGVGATSKTNDSNPQYKSDMGNVCDRRGRWYMKFWSSYS